jgi:hypothetical protein
MKPFGRDVTRPSALLRHPSSWTVEVRAIDATLVVERCVRLRQSTFPTAVWSRSV